MTPLEDAVSLSGNCPAGVFRDLVTYQWSEDNTLLETVDDDVYYKVVDVVWNMSLRGSTK
jgi:hypothetical protein